MRKPTEAELEKSITDLKNLEDKISAAERKIIMLYEECDVSDENIQELEQSESVNTAEMQETIAIFRNKITTATQNIEREEQELVILQAEKDRLQFEIARQENESQSENATMSRHASLDSQSSDASTIVEGYDPSSDTESDTTEQEPYIRSSSETKKAQTEEEITEITRDKEQFRKLILKGGLINDDARHFQAEIEKLEKEIYSVQEGVIRNPFFEFEFKVDLPTIDDMVKNYDTLPKIIRTQPNKPADQLNAAELDNAFDNCISGLDSLVRHVKSLTVQRDNLAPKSGFARFFYAIVRVITHLFGGETALEKAEQALNEKKSETDDRIYNARLVVASSRVYLSKCLKEQSELRSTLKEIHKDEEENNKELQALAARYKIPPDDNLSRFDDNAMHVFKKYIGKKSLDLEINSDENLIKRCSTFFTYGAAYEVKKSLKIFLQQPTKTNLAALNSVMQANPDYIKDHSVISLLKDAKILYPDIPRISLVQMNIVKIDDHFKPKLMKLEEEKTKLEEEKQSLETRINTQDPELLKTQDAIQANFLALQKCKNLLLNAELSKKIRDSEASGQNQELNKMKQQLNKLNESVIAYLNLKISQIMKELPQSEHINAQVILEQTTKESYYNFNCDIYREEIKDIFSQYDINIVVPSEPLTRDGIKAFCKTLDLDDDAKKALLREIMSLEGIQTLANSLYEENEKEGAAVLQCIQDKSGYPLNDELSYAMSQCNIAANDAESERDQEAIDDAFIEFDTNYLQNISNALNVLEEKLKSYQEKYSKVDDVIKQIQNIRLPYSEIEKMIGPIQTISPQVVNTQQINTKSLQEQRETIDLKLKKINFELNSTKEVYKECVTENLPPHEIPAELATIIAGCKSTTNYIGNYISNVFTTRSSLAQNNYRSTLAQFLTLPTIKNLQTLHDAMEKYPSNQRTQQDEKFLEITSSYYPQITVPVLALNADKSTQQDVTSGKSASHKERLNTLKFTQPSSTEEQPTPTQPSIR